MWKWLVVAGLLAGGMALEAGSETCFYKAERESGLNKICVYSCPSGDASMTVKSYQVCPVTWKR